MPEQKLYQYVSISANTGAEDEGACEARVMSAVRPLKDVFNIERVPHMLAYDQPGEVTFGVLVERGADLEQVKNAIQAATGIPPASMMTGPGLVHP